MKNLSCYIITVFLAMGLMFPIMVDAQPPNVPPGPPDSPNVPPGPSDSPIDVLQDQIDAEEAARIAADQDLQNQIDAEEAARVSGDSTEAAARAAADANLQQQINEESAARQNADAILQGATEAESAQRQTNDQAILDYIEAIKKTYFVCPCFTEEEINSEMPNPTDCSDDNSTMLINTSLEVSTYSQLASVSYDANDDVINGRLCQYSTYTGDEPPYAVIYRLLTNLSFIDAQACRQIIINSDAWGNCP